MRRSLLLVLRIGPDAPSRSLLEKDEARLSSFESGRAKVEKAERKERSKNVRTSRSNPAAPPDPVPQMHPLLHELLNAKPAAEPHSELDLFARSTISNAWISERARAALPRKPLPRLADESSSEDESEGEYDVSPFLLFTSHELTFAQPTKDDYLVRLSQRLGTSLAEIERSLDGVSRVETFVSRDRKSVV